MPSLEIISVNLWQILISLANLLILLFILKKFLYAPVKGVLAQRQADIDRDYDEAARAKQDALDDKEHWQSKMLQADDKAQKIISTATANAQNRSEKIVSDAKSKAEGILRQAELDASLEIKKAEDTIKNQIAEVSASIAQKMLEREINASDHTDLIDSFISDIGDDDGTDK